MQRGLQFRTCFAHTLPSIRRANALCRLPRATSNGHALHTILPHTARRAGSPRIPVLTHTPGLIQRALPDCGRICSCTLCGCVPIGTKRPHWACAALSRAAVCICSNRAPAGCQCLCHSAGCCLAPPTGTPHMKLPDYVVETTPRHTGMLMHPALQWRACLHAADRRWACWHPQHRMTLFHMGYIVLSDCLHTSSTQAHTDMHPRSLPLPAAWPFLARTPGNPDHQHTTHPRDTSGKTPPLHTGRLR
eukprot:2557923-Rhodomonas_salina.5